MRFLKRRLVNQLSSMTHLTTVKTHRKKSKTFAGHTVEKYEDSPSFYDSVKLSDDVLKDKKNFKTGSCGLIKVGLTLQY